MYDILIIGGGPAGLSAAVYAKRERLESAVIEKEYMGTGQIAESERVDNYLGLYGTNGFNLGKKFREHAEAFDVQFIEGEVRKIIPENNLYTLELCCGNKLQTKAIIYAAGAAARKLDIKGESEFTGRGVSYCAVCDGAFYKNKTVAVIGGGDTALQDAVLLSKTAEKVYLVHRRDEFRANKALQEKVKSTANITLALNTVPTEIVGSKKVEALVLSTNGAERKISVDGVFAAVGNIPNTVLLQGIAELDKNGYIIADESGVTSAKGVFAAGDVRAKPLRQIITAVADGANCVISAEKYLS